MTKKAPLKGKKKEGVPELFRSLLGKAPGGILSAPLLREKFFSRFFLEIRGVAFIICKNLLSEDFVPCR